MVEYKYDAWGYHTISGSNTALGVLNPFRYRSYYFDTETKLYYLQSRYYDPVVGRFLNMDSIDYADPETINGLNLYAYCGNNPVMFTDSYGTDFNGFLNDVSNWFISAGNWINNNIIQPTVTFLEESWDLVIAGGGAWHSSGCDGSSIFKIWARGSFTFHGSRSDSRNCVGSI